MTNVYLNFSKGVKKGKQKLPNFFPLCISELCYCFHYLWGVKFSDRWTSLTEMNCSHLTTSTVYTRLAFTFHFWHSCPKLLMMYCTKIFFSHGFCAMTRSGSTPSLSFIYYKSPDIWIREYVVLKVLYFLLLSVLSEDDDSVISRSQATYLKFYSCPFCHLSRAWIAKKIRASTFFVLLSVVVTTD